MKRKLPLILALVLTLALFGGLTSCSPESNKKNIKPYYRDDGTLSYTCEYNDKNQLILRTEYETNGKYVSRRTRYEYNNDGSYFAKTFMADGTIKYESHYDTEGNLILDIFYDISGEVSFYVRTEYEEDGSYLEKYYTPGDILDFTRSYDKDGNTQVIYYYKEDGKTIFFYEVYAYFEYGSYQIKQYDENDAPLILAIYNSDDERLRLISFLRDEDGNNFASIESFDDATHIVSTYDEDGLLSGGNRYDKDEKELSSIEYRYREDGKTLSLSRERYLDGSYLQTYFTAGGLYEHTDLFSAEDKILSSTYYERDGKTIKYRKDYTYDEDGTLIP